MKQKTLRIIVISLLLMTSLLIGSPAYAQDEDLPDPGITPDSPVYFLDTWGKNIALFFAFSPEAKAKKALQYAEERLAEASVMAAKNKVREMTRAANDYDGFMAMVKERAEEARQHGVSDNISERIALATSKHLSVLDRVKDQMPEGAREAIARARIASMNGHKFALRALAGKNPERAIDLNLDAIEGRLKRAKVKATENITAEVEEALADAAELVEMEGEISSIAEGLGKDVAKIEQRVARASSNRLEVLAEVYAEAPDTAKPAIENAMQNSMRKYEHSVERLKEKNALGDILEEVPALQRIRTELAERLRLATSGNTTDNITAQVRVRERISSIKPETPELTVSANGTRGREAVTSSENVSRPGP